MTFQVKNGKEPNTAAEEYWVFVARTKTQNSGDDEVNEMHI